MKNHKIKNKRWVSLVCLILLIICIILPGMPVMASSGTGITITGVVPLRISDVLVSGMTPSSAVISWDTNGGSISQVFYDIIPHANATDYAYQSSLDNTLVMQHSVTLTGLASGTTYHFSVQSQATINGILSVATSSDYPFTTSGSGGSGGGTVITTTTTPLTTLTITPPTTTPTTTTEIIIPTTTPTITPSTALIFSEQVTAGNNMVTQTNVLLNSNGVSIEGGQISTTDGSVSFDVGAGTRMLDANGKPITEVTASKPSSYPPAVPPDVIMASYTFGPSGSSFSPPLTMTLKYDTLLSGVKGNTLFIAWWDGTQWLEIPGTIDPATQTVTAQVPHFTNFVVMGTETTSPLWALLTGIIITAIVVIGLLIYFLIVRRQHKKGEFD